MEENRPLNAEEQAQVAEDTRSPEERAIAALEAAEAPKAQEAPVETPEPEPEVEAKAETPQVAEALAKIARAEARSRSKLQELEANIQSKAAEIEAKEKELNRYFDVFKAFDADPDLAVEALSGIMGKSKSEPQIPQEFLEKFQQLQSEVEQFKTEALTQRQQANVAAYKNNILSAISEGESRHILAEAQLYGLSPADLVYSFAEEWFNNHGEILPPDQGCKLLEKTLKTKLDNYTKAGLLGTPSASQPAETKVSDPSPTLTNRSSSTVATLSDSTDMGEEARIKRATALLEKLTF